MELELATTDDIVRELRARGQLFLFVGMGTTNRKEKQLTYAFQGGTRSELLLLMEGLQQVLAEAHNENGDAE